MVDGCTRALHLNVERWSLTSCLYPGLYSMWETHFIGHWIMAATGPVKGLQHSGVLGDHSNQVILPHVQWSLYWGNSEGRWGFPSNFCLVLETGYDCTLSGSLHARIWGITAHSPSCSKEDAQLIMQITGCHLCRERRRGMPSDHCCHLPVRHRVIGGYVWQSQRTLSHRLRIHSMLAGNQVAWVS